MITNPSSLDLGVLCLWGSKTCRGKKTIKNVYNLSYCSPIDRDIQYKCVYVYIYI